MYTHGSSMLLDVGQLAEGEVVQEDPSVVAVPHRFQFAWYTPRALQRRRLWCKRREPRR